MNDDPDDELLTEDDMVQVAGGFAGGLTIAGEAL